MSVVVEINNIHRAYKRGVDVLDGVTFSIEAGQVVGLVGKNGAGKTTLIRIAMGMIEPQQGYVKLFGLFPHTEPLEVKRRVGYVSEDQILPPFLTVGEVIDLHRGLFPKWDDGMEKQFRDRFALSRTDKIKQLSKGQARQVALLCAVCHRPELLLLDEPAGGLDPAARREFLETSIHYLNEEGSTILFSSHYMSDVERLADRIVMLHDGKTLIDEPLDSLQENYSLALVPHEANVTRERLLGLDSCLGVRDRVEALHVVFRNDPETSRVALERELGIANTRCTTIALEDMFIELAGGQS
jgi:ABC-2 type transport system ATP-binding protein